MIYSLTSVLTFGMSSISANRRLKGHDRRQSPVSQGSPSSDDSVFFSRQRNPDQDVKLLIKTALSYLETRRFVRQLEEVAGASTSRVTVKKSERRQAQKDGRPIKALKAPSQDDWQETLHAMEKVAHEENGNIRVLLRNLIRAAKDNQWGLSDQQDIQTLQDALLPICETDGHIKAPFEEFQACCIVIEPSPVCGSAEGGAENRQPDRSEKDEADLTGQDENNVVSREPDNQPPAETSGMTGQAGDRDIPLGLGNELPVDVPELTGHDAAVSSPTEQPPEVPPAPRGSFCAFDTLAKAYAARAAAAVEAAVKAGESINPSAESVPQTPADKPPILERIRPEARKDAEGLIELLDADQAQLKARLNQLYLKVAKRSASSKKLKGFSYLVALAYVVGQVEPQKREAVFRTIANLARENNVNILGLKTEECLKYL